MSTWEPISTAPLNEDIRIGGDQIWGPMVWLRGGEDRTKGHWRFARGGWEDANQRNVEYPGRWEDQHDQPLTFTPTEWSEIDG